MSSLRDYIREVRNAAAEHLEARYRDDVSSATQHLPREQALVTIALVTVRLLEQQLQNHSADDAGRRELQSHLKACRRALKSLTSSVSAADDGNAAPPKRSRTEAAEGHTATSSTAVAAQRDTAKSVELGQYAATDAFGQNEEKRMKFARLMGGAKVAAGSDGSGNHAHHNTHAKSSAEVRRMNENLEREFEYAMTHKGKKGLGA